MGLLKTAARTAVASSVHGRVQRRQSARWAQQDAHPHAAAPAAAAAPPPPPPPPPAPAPPPQPPPGPAQSGSDTGRQLELLKQLGELRDAGILNDSEFEAKKAEILGT